MKLTLDTNIFISAFYWGGNPQKVIDRIIEGLDELYLCSEILDEIAKVMMRPKFKSGPQIIDAYIKTIEKTAKKVYIAGTIKGVCRDKDDDRIIECGILSGADYIITGDDDLLVLEKFQEIKIVTADQYLDLL